MKLPKYLTDIISHLAKSEEKTGGMKASKALEVFRSELIDESLTAKANPSPASNPTIKPFIEIYDVVGEAFAKSPLGKALGFIYRKGTVKTGTSSAGKRKNIPINSVSRRKGEDLFSGGKEYVTVDNSEGKKFFEDLRQFAVKVSDEVTRAVYGERTERRDTVFGKRMKNWYTASAGEHLKREPKSPHITAGEYNESMVLSEQTRYRKLLVRGLVVGLLEPLFDINERDLDGMLYELVKDVPLKDLGQANVRRAFLERVIELMRDREGIIKATVDASDYVGKEMVGGGVIGSNFINLLVELYKIKESNSPVRILGK